MREYRWPEEGWRGSARPLSRIYWPIVQAGFVAELETPCRRVAGVGRASRAASLLHADVRVAWMLGRMNLEEFAKGGDEWRQELDGR